MQKKEDKTENQNIGQSNYIYLIVLVFIGMLTMFSIGIMFANFSKNTSNYDLNEKVSKIEQKKETLKNKKEVTVKTKKHTLENPKTATTKKTKKIKKEKTHTLNLASTGCMLFHESVLDSYKKNDGSYDFNNIFKYIKKTYSKYDLISCEYEGAVSDARIGYKGYPEFHYPASTITALKNSGVDLFMCATNHSLDVGDVGVNLTLNALNDNGVDFTGIRKDGSVKNYITVVKNKIKIGYVDFTYSIDGKLNSKSLNAVTGTQINYFSYSNLEEFYTQAAQIYNAMKNEGVDFTVMNIHYGDEYKITPNPFQVDIANRLAEMKYDVIVGGHPHVVEGIDVKTSSDGAHNTLVAYSVGNALSNQMACEIPELLNTGHTEDGMILNYKITKKNDEVKIVDVDVLPTWVYRGADKGGKTFDYYILPLKKISNLEKKTGLSNIAGSLQASYDRTMAIVSPGLEKAKSIYEKK